MTSQTLDLEQHITSPPEVDAERLQRLNAKLEELAKGGFVVEELPRAQLAHQAAVYTYPKLSMDFLSHANEKEWKNRYNGWVGKIQVPRFGVFRLNSPRMTIEFAYNGWTYGFSFRVTQPVNFPEVMEKPLVRSTEVFRDIDENDIVRLGNGRYGAHSFLVPRTIEKKYKQALKEGIEISSTFHGLIPTETRGKIKEAQRLFGNEIYLVAETAPEEWNVRRAPRIVKDPILVGVAKNEAFYLDRFDTTPMEEYVAKEFSS